MVVPDAGSDISVDYGHVVALPPPQDGNPPLKSASQYATIRNNGTSPTTVSLVYTYQRETLNPGLDDLLAADLSEIELAGNPQAAPPSLTFNSSRHIALAANDG